jgi:hypothetical protein
MTLDTPSRRAAARRSPPARPRPRARHLPVRHLRRLAALLALVAPSGIAAQSAGALQSRAAEEASVRAAVEAYLRSHATGDGSHVRAVFHPALQMLWVVNDTLARRTAEQYVAGFRGTPAADEARRRRWIASVEVFGTAATARVILDYPTTTFVDLFTLLKVQGEWRIVSKVFASEPKPPATP